MYGMAKKKTRLLMSDDHGTTKPNKCITRIGCLPIHDDGRRCIALIFNHCTAINKLNALNERWSRRRMWK